MKSAISYTCRIWIAGNYDDALRSVRAFCEEGACFAVERVEYVYTGGQEAGVCVTRINYPRFPTDAQTIFGQCLRLGKQLQADLFQDSFSIETPHETYWITRRRIDRADDRGECTA